VPANVQSAGHPPAVRHERQQVIAG
jgi:hypothetical protein